MLAAPPPPADEQRGLAGLTARVLAAAEPVVELMAAQQALEHKQEFALSAALFDSLVWRLDLRHYWTCFHAARAYSQLAPARDDAAYLTASMALQMHPDWDGANQMFRILFEVLERRGRAGDIAEVIGYQLEHMPEKIAVEPHETAAVLAAAAGPAPRAPAPPAAGSRLAHPVAPAELRAGWEPPVFGGPMPFSLRPLARPQRRPPIEVMELRDAELLLCRDNVLVLDRDGALHEDLSVANFPHHARRKVERLEAAGGIVEAHDIDAAVVIADRFPPPNLCHFLLDQITRLALYRRAGVDTGRALVVGPPASAPFQRALLARAGVSRLLDTNRVARLRVARLWVSTNCRGLEHAAHLGAEWAVRFAQQVVGGQGVRGWRRLYVSRGDVQQRQVRNEAEVVALLDRHGFESIQPGTMSYDAQVAAFRQASHVIGAHGAALTHLVACPPGAKALEMFHPLYGTSAFAQQCPAAGIDYAAMLARDAVSDAPEWNDPDLTDIGRSRFLGQHLRVDLTVLRRYLDTVL